jgi:hypothetical protein
MKDSLTNPKPVPKALVYVASIVVTALLGYIDYLSSDYSLALFYIMIIVATTWYSSLVFGIMSAVFSTAVEAVSDYYVHGEAVFHPVYYWNWGCDLVVFVIICALVDIIKKETHTRKTPR